MHVRADEISLQAYAKAQAQGPHEACRLFSQLSEQKDFTLRTLALIKAHMTCETSELLELKVAAAPQNIIKELGPSMSFLKTINDQRALIEAERSQDPTQLATAWKSKALASDRIKDKVDYLQKALQYTQAALTKSSSDQASELNGHLDDIQNRIYALAPRLKTEVSPTDYQKVGADFTFNREFERGRFYFEKILNSTDAKTFNFDAKYQAFKSLRGSYKIEQNREMHIATSEKMTRWLLQKKAKASVIHEAYITWARSLWTFGKPDEAKATLIAGKKRLMGRDPVDEFEFILGRMAEEKQDYKLSLSHYEEGLQLSNKRSLFYEKLLFSKGWSLRNLGRYQEAALVFEDLKTRTQDPFDVFRYQFWQAKSYKQGKQTEAARAVFSKLQTEDHLGYYGLLAYLEMNEQLPPLTQVNPLPTTTTTRALDQETRRMIHALLYVNEAEVLEKYLNMKTQDLRTFGEKDSEVWLAYLKAYAQAGLFLPLFTQLGNLDNKLKLELLTLHPDLLFPQKYTEIIFPWAEKLQVKPELVLSIIRQESAFNPMARSPADAFGLMQVLPRIATEQETVTGIKLQHHEDLYSPEKNIPVGIALLSHLGKKYRGQFILTAAAYNSSEKAIEGWLKTRLKEDPLEFIEDIPYDETRAYVKLVIRNFIFYSRLNQPQTAMSFPKWCLEDLHSSVL